MLLFQLIRKYIVNKRQDDGRGKKKKIKNIDVITVILS